jgi:hypothetical protein
MVKRQGLGKGKGKGYYNILLHDPLIHRMSSKGIKTKLPLVKTTVQPLGKEFKDWLKKEEELVERYALLKSTEKSHLYRVVRKKQLAKRKKFLEHVLSRKWLDVKNHTYKDLMQGFNEYIIVENEFGKRKIDLTAKGKQLDKEKEQPDDIEKMFNKAQTHRLSKPEFWKKLRKQFEDELEWTKEQLSAVELFEKEAQLKKQKKEIKKRFERGEEEHLELLKKKKKTEKRVSRRTKNIINFEKDLMKNFTEKETELFSKKLAFVYDESDESYDINHYVMEKSMSEILSEKTNIPEGQAREKVEQFMKILNKYPLDVTSFVLDR